jgi:mannose-6-phosphate isomerase-like protein (cupin superfamily)
MEIKNVYRELERVTPDEKGDCFSIPEKTVHQLVNTGAGRLCAMFICSPTHLSTDRFFLGDQL